MVSKHSFQEAQAVVTVNWTDTGTVNLLQVTSPGHEPADVVLLSRPYRVVLLDGVWTEASIDLVYDLADLVDVGTVTLLWYDPVRGIWVPSTGQQREPDDARISGDLPSEDVVLAIFGALSASNQNNPPLLAISYDIKDAYVDERMEFDASASTDPDGGTLLFYWDFNDDGELGPWVAGVRASYVFRTMGTHELVLRAIDGQNEHLLYQNITIRAERDVQPGPFDNKGALFMLGSMLVIAFGLAIAYRLHRPKTYDDLFGKAYRTQEEDEYSQLFRKLTEQDLLGEMEEEVPEGGTDTGEAEDTEESEESEEAPDSGEADGTGKDRGRQRPGRKAG
jgi:hypothetical protein